MAILDVFRGRQQQPSPDGDAPAKFPQFTIFSRPGSSLGNSTPSSGLATPTEEKGLTELGPCPEIGRLASWKGALILLVTSGSQFLDNVFMTSANVALSSIQDAFDVSDTNLQWMISAYTLTFGGFLLLAGVLSDRYGRKMILCLGLTWLSIWTLAIGFGQSFIQLTVFRGLQGIGAALTVPSAIGIISAYFSGLDRTRALSIYASSGTVGFCDNLAGKEKPKMDYVGAMLSTAGLILLQFVLSSGGVYGWGTPFIIVLLILAVALLVAFTLWEKYISYPLMPLGLWKLPNFAGLWIAGFTCYGSYQNVIYYIVLMAQEVDKLSAGQTAIRFLPMGAIGFIASMGTGKALEYVNGKYTLLAGLVLTVVAPIPSAITSSPENSFWLNVLPTSLISITAVSLIFVTTSTAILTTVPVNVKSLCGGMLNTAFQIGSGVALAISAAVTEAVDIKKGHDLAHQYSTGLWCSAGLAGLGLLIAMFSVRRRGIGPGDRDDSVCAI
ncbi:MFS general substrate transporter [Aspergillus sclerotioniger CBS 115572]|uniref:MFS general substrate transporter n=1 Tax=Aspergillus sclerotioniger CBS 115572 TaxID=1450535 RepID=A0A317XGY1_9EURO|nr:MFS general substrate transporter [Aspergillus sclerotioniger CBS 115572]PWY96658.1 MFS general substrate transporter [Aspergillus sclerotioniger CBS 115572]